MGFGGVGRVGFGGVGRVGFGGVGKVGSGGEASEYFENQINWSVL